MVSHDLPKDRRSSICVDRHFQVVQNRAVRSLTSLRRAAERLRVASEIAWDPSWPRVVLVAAGMSAAAAGEARSTNSRQSIPSDGHGLQHLEIVVSSHPEMPCDMKATPRGCFRCLAGSRWLAAQMIKDIV